MCAKLDYFLLLSSKKSSSENVLPLELRQFISLWWILKAMLAQVPLHELWHRAGSRWLRIYAVNEKIFCNIKCSSMREDFLRR